MPTLRLAIFLDTTFQYTILGCATAMFAFSAATLNSPLFDESVLNFDRSIGFDWYKFARFIADHPTLRTILNFGYMSLFWQAPLLLAMLCFSKRYRETDRFIIANLIAMLVTVMIFAACPVTTAWVHTGVSQAELKALHLQSGTGGWVRQLFDIRNGRTSLVSAHMDFGIIGFPSFHAISAFLNIGAFWALRRLRIIAVVLNGIMIVSTLIVGGHYLADITAAGLVTWISIMGARSIMALSSRGQARPSLSDAAHTLDAGTPVAARAHF